MIHTNPVDVFPKPTPGTALNALIDLLDLRDANDKVSLVVALPIIFFIVR